MIPYPKVFEYPILIEGTPEFNINAYSLETVIAEKFQSMISLSTYNSRMKDFFDIYCIMKGNTFDGDSLMDAIIATFKNRKTEYMDKHPVFSKAFYTDQARKKQWQGFLRKSHIKEAPSFEEIGDFMRKVLYPYWERLKKI